MSYVRKIVIKDEKLLVLTRLHWIYPIEGIIWFALMLSAGLLLEHYFYTYIGAQALHFRVDLGWLEFTEQNTPIPWIFGLAGFAIFWPLFVKYISTEVGLTNQRIIHKKGLIFIEIDQVDLEDIRGEHIIHGWLGWLLGYGRIHVDCRFIKDMHLPAISDPYTFIKTSHTARMKHPLIDYTELELGVNLDEIEQRKKKAIARQHLRTIKELIKANFRKAS